MALWDKFGINFGHDIVEGGTYNTAEIDRDLDYLINYLGIKHFRVGGVGLYYIGLSANTLTKMRYLAQRPLQLGATSVQYVLDFEVNDTNHNGYEDYVTTEAAWAESVGVTRLQLCNELELDADNGYTEAEERDFVISCAQIAKNAGYTGKIVHSLAGGAKAWTAANKGIVDELGFNAQIRWVTGNTTASWLSWFRDFVNTIGEDNAFVSEWSGWDNQYNREPMSLAAEMRRLEEGIKARLPNTTIPQYFFAWRKPDDYYVARNMVGNNLINYYFFDIVEARHPTVYGAHDFAQHARKPVGSFNVGNCGGKILWLKADEGVYSDNGGDLCRTYGERVRLWLDYSGKGNHGYQTEGYKQPVYHSDTLNGKPIIWFNSGDLHSMKVGNTTSFNTDTPTIFTVARLAAGTSIFGRGDATNNYYQGTSGGHRKFQLCFFSATQQIWRFGSDTQWIGRTIDGTYVYRIYMLCAQYNAKTITGVNGVEAISTTTLNYNTHNGTLFQLACGFNNEAERGNCDIAEILIWDRSLNEWERRGVTQYLADKWGISVTNTAPESYQPRDDAFNRTAAETRMIARG